MIEKGGAQGLSSDILLPDLHSKRYSGTALAILSICEWSEMLLPLHIARKLGKVVLVCRILRLLAEESRKHHLNGQLSLGPLLIKANSVPPREILTSTTVSNIYI